MRKIIRVDGSEEPITGCAPMSEMRRLLGVEGLSSVSLHHLGKPLVVMLIDDTGYITNKPINPKATALYHANCVPGTTHPICGDVALMFDDDYHPGAKR